MVRSVALRCLLLVLLPNWALPHVWFVENRGQWKQPFYYRAALSDGAVFLDSNGLRFHFPALPARHGKPAQPQGQAFAMDLLGARIRAGLIEARQPAPFVENHFVGRDPQFYRSNMKPCAEVWVHEVYPGIDLVVGSSSGGHPKYSFRVMPGADPSRITWRYKGLSSPPKLESGNLVLHSSRMHLIENAPIAWSAGATGNREVPCAFRLDDRELRFSFPKNYNKRDTLWIDPTLVFASYSGSEADNFGMTATYDAQGNLYSGGMAFQVGYPTTLGAYDVTASPNIGYGAPDVVITKYNASGSALVYSTFLGGSQGETVNSLVVNAQGQLYAFGVTGSADFPVPNGAFQTFSGGQPENLSSVAVSFPNGADAYVARFSADGSQLLGCTYMGGTDNDGVLISSEGLYYNYGDYFRGEIVLDEDGACYVATTTRSLGLQTAGNPVQSTAQGGSDGWVFRLSPDLSQLQWSTYLGGSNDDAAYGLDVAKDGSVFVTGGTASNTFPAGNNGPQAGYQGNVDGFLVRLKPGVSTLLGGTFLGTSQYDQSYFVKLDKRSRVYVYGQTAGPLPVFNSSYVNPGSGQFVRQYNPQLTTLLASTTLGNGQGISLSPSAFLVDRCNRVYISGWGGSLANTNMLNLPLTSDALQDSTDGQDFYFAVLEPDFAGLLYASYLGGNISQEHVDGGTSRFDPNGIIYQSVCGGCGGHSDFPTTAGSWSQQNLSANCNNAVFKFDFELPFVNALYSTSGVEGCAPYSATLQNQSNGNAFVWLLPGGGRDSVQTSLNLTFSQPGNYSVTLVAQNPLACNGSDTAVVNFTVHPKPDALVTATTQPCSNQVSLQGPTALTCSWSWPGGTATGASVQAVFPAGSTPVTLIATNSFGCSDTIVLPVVTFPQGDPEVETPKPRCNAAPVALNASGGDGYRWFPITGLSNPSSSNPLASPNQNITYNVDVFWVQPSGDTCRQVLSVPVFVSPFLNQEVVAEATPAVVYNNEICMLKASYTGGSIVWSPAAGLSQPNAAISEARVTTNTVFLATVSDNLGCTWTDTASVGVLKAICGDPNVGLPNLFSPNDDGKNDVLKVMGGFVGEIRLEVFNRWGQRVYDGNATQGWDGLMNGLPADPGVYGYRMSGTCRDGVSFQDKGNITLVR
jgi:gliding motility-associated-like protein